MLTIQGKPVCAGTAFGRIALYKRRTPTVRPDGAADPASETTRFEQARQRAIAGLGELSQKAAAELGEDSAQIFEIHQLMLDDDDFIEAILDGIRNAQPAEQAVTAAGDQFAATFAAMDDEYMKERAADVRDITARLLSVLSGEEQATVRFDEPVILLADDLAPSETVQLDKTNIRAFVTMDGSPQSHTAILSRTMNIPAIVCTGRVDAAADGKPAIADGGSGTLYIEPDDKTAARLRAQADEQARADERLLAFREQETRTRDGRQIKLMANIGGAEDAIAALKQGAEGVGLFRSEFLYLEQDDYPSEEQQYAAYRAVAEAMAGRQVIVRTLDIGADKQIGYFGLDREENPAMGYRAIRICLDRPEILRTQLRALYRASAHGNIAIMFPLITAVDEVRALRAMADSARAELQSEGVPMAERVELGIMIETPAAAVISDLLAAEADFFSIGTNDLTQYLLAVDRQNAKLERYYDPHHPALLRLIRQVADSAHVAGKWVGVCGELAADPQLSAFFLDCGIDELSVAPPRILPLREKICGL